MIPKPLAQVAQADLQALIDDQVREGKTIDYKRDLPGGNDEAKREFLADVSSFANTSGGDLIFGMDEAAGLPTGFPGVASPNMDIEIQRLENILRTGLEPRLPGVEMRAVDLGAGNHLPIIRVRQSWAAPHRVIYREHSKFYGRNSAGKYALDVGELRVAFTTAEGVIARIRRFRDDRLMKISVRDTPVEMNPGAMAALHVVPLAAIARRTEIDLTDRNALGQLRPPQAMGFNSRRNLDGFVNHTGDAQRPAHAYAQIFRDGILEFVQVFTPDDDDHRVHSVSYENSCIQSLQQATEFYRQVAVEPPFYVFLSLLGLRRYRLGVNVRWFLADDQAPIDRDALILPEVVIDELGAPAHTILRPLFDMVWNAWGYDRCLNYDAAGVWHR